VFEVDQTHPLVWKRRRLVELGFGIPESLRLVPVDFETGASWLEAIAGASTRVCLQSSSPLAFRCT
jgi:O-methyltransferase involved in polyketide biosynthesis